MNLLIYPFDLYQREFFEQSVYRSIKLYGLEKTIEMNPDYPEYVIRTAYKRMLRRWNSGKLHTPNGNNTPNGNSWNK